MGRCITIPSLGSIWLLSNCGSLQRQLTGFGERLRSAGENHEGRLNLLDKYQVCVENACRNQTEGCRVFLPESRRSHEVTHRMITQLQLD